MGEEERPCALSTFGEVRLGFGTECLDLLVNILKLENKVGDLGAPEPVFKKIG